MNSEQEQLHFIGVGGVGMSGIARVAHDQGMAVSGSDIKESRYTKQLRDAGVTVFIGQDGANIPDGDVTVVVSTAILENNPELIEARRRNLPIVHRAQMLARLGRDLDTLAVAGTHGKTTTSSMLASTLDAMGYDPTFLIGGIVRAYGTNAHSGLRPAPTWWRPTSPTSPSPTSPRRRPSSRTSRRITWTTTRGSRRFTPSSPRSSPGCERAVPSSCAAMTRNWRRWPAAPAVR